MKLVVIAIVYYKILILNCIQIGVVEILMISIMKIDEMLDSGSN